MSSIDAKRAYAARESRRRHLQQRQTLVFGSLIAGLLVIGLAAGAVWVGILPAPVNVPIHSPEPESTAPPAPCPPDGALPVPMEEIATHVYNGTSRSGLAAGTAASLSERGVIIGEQGNAPGGYDGIAIVTTGASTIAHAYTLAAQFPEATIELDARTEDTMTVVVGEQFDGLLPAESVELDPEVPLEPVAGCEPVILEDEAPADEGEGDSDDGEDEG